MKSSLWLLAIGALVSPVLYSQASRAQGEMAVQNARTHQLDSLSDSSQQPEKQASIPWKSLSSEEADDPTISGATITEKPPRNARKAAEQAEKLSRKNRHEEAIAGFRNALSIDPLYYEAANNLALELEAVGRNADAEKLLRDLTRSAPQHILAFGNLAALLAQQQRYVEAEAVSREALNVHRYSFRASFFLGTSLVNQGKWNEEAKRNLEYAQIRYAEANVLLKKWPGSSAR